MTIFNKIFFSALILLTTIVVNGQSISELQKQKEKTAQEIEYINNLLKETGKNSRASLNRLAVLEKQMRLQNEMINNINSEITFIDFNIAKNLRLVDSLTNQLAIVKAKYATMIRYARRNQDANNQLLFLLSADDFNQAYKRFVYLRQYADYRRRQAEQINTIATNLATEITNYNQQKSAKEVLLVSKVKQTEIIEQQKITQTEYHAQLQQKEKDLSQKLENQRKTELKLQQEIERIIAEEARKTAEKTKTTPGFTMTPEDKILSDDFSKNRGRFPWPVAKGVITDHFGEHPHPVLKYVTIRNAGIDITTQNGEKARSIFKGEVSKVVAIPGGNTAVIIRHGSFLSVYSNLVNVVVQTGQKVDTKQELGSIFTDTDDQENKTILKFQIWQENKKLDPEAWLEK